MLNFAPPPLQTVQTVTRLITKHEIFAKQIWSGEYVEMKWAVCSVVKVKKVMPLQAMKAYGRVAE